MKPSPYKTSLAHDLLSIIGHSLGGLSITRLILTVPHLEFLCWNNIDRFISECLSEPQNHTILVTVQYCAKGENSSYKGSKPQNPILHRHNPRQRHNILHPLVIPQPPRWNAPISLLVDLAEAAASRVQIVMHVLLFHRRLGWASATTQGPKEKSLGSNINGGLISWMKNLTCPQTGKGQEERVISLSLFPTSICRESKTSDLCTGAGITTHLRNLFADGVRFHSSAPPQGWHSHSLSACTQISKLITPDLNW